MKCQDYYNADKVSLAKQLILLNNKKRIRFQNEFVFYSNKSSKKSLELKQCEYCDKPANKLCDDCQANYCSIQCVKLDTDHLIRCKNINEKIYEIPMNRAELCQTSVPLQAEPIKNKSPVLITCAVDHRTLFIRPTNPDDNNEYIKILNDVIADARKSEYLRKYPSLGSLVSAPFQKVYYRAMILKMINENELVVGFIDFGNVEVCQFSELKQLSVNLQRRKRFAKKVILRNVPEKCLNRDALLIINELIVNDMKLTIHFDDMQSNLCTLTPRNLTESLNSLIISKFKPSCLIKERDLFFDEVIFVYVICLSFQFLLFELK